MALLIRLIGAVWLEANSNSLTGCERLTLSGETSGTHWFCDTHLCKELDLHLCKVVLLLAIEHMISILRCI